ncbi:uncharacterized protein KZ484_007346 [Pholidichthys leucotaenia]
MGVLASHSVTLNKEKCFLAEETTESVGFRLTVEGLSPRHSNVEGVLQLPKPTTPAQISSFLGMVNFYRHFIPHYSKMTEPLHALLKQDALWEWTPACSAAIK